MVSCHLFAIVAFLATARAQRVPIWSYAMTSESDLGDWNNTLGGSIQSNIKCPVESSCYAYERDQEIKRYTSSAGYHSVQLEWSLETEKMTENYCELWTIVGQSSNWRDWTEVAGYVSDGTSTTFTLDLPDDENI